MQFVPYVFPCGSEGHFSNQLEIRRSCGHLQKSHWARKDGVTEKYRPRAFAVVVGCDAHRALGVVVTLWHLFLIYLKLNSLSFRQRKMYISAYV